MSKEIQLRKAIEHAEENIIFLASLPDKKLREKLDVIDIQGAIAEEKKNTAALELLEIWRSQVIEARIYKAENAIADSPNEIELAIAGIETVVTKTEQRQEILNDYSKPENMERKKVKSKQENNNQLTLFE